MVQNLEEIMANTCVPIICLDGVLALTSDWNRSVGLDVVRSSAEVFKLLEKSSAKRRTAGTDLNEKSR
jgi:hypothetical protein